MESLKTQIEFYRLKDHNIPNIDTLSQEELEAVLKQLQDADYERFKKSMTIAEPLFMNMALGIFGPSEKNIESIKSSVIVDIIQNPDNYELLNYRLGSSQHDICLAKIHRIKCLYVLSLMNNYRTLGDAFDSDDYETYVRLMRYMDIYVEQYKLLTPDILKRITESNEYAHIFLDPDVVAIMDRIKSEGVDLQPISVQTNEDLKTTLKESLLDFKTSMAELRQVLSEHREPITISPENAEVLNGSLLALSTSLNQLRENHEGEEKCCIM